MKSLEAFGVSKISTQELKNLEGGWWQYVGGAVAAFFFESAANPQASYDSFMDGFNAAMDK
ncbi:MAG: hypothetical protein AAF717_17810 [Bacteroidota bacterium]